MSQSSHAEPPEALLIASYAPSQPRDAMGEASSGCKNTQASTLTDRNGLNIRSPINTLSSLTRFPAVAVFADCSPPIDPTLAALIDLALGECAFHERLTPDADMHAVAADTATAAIEAWQFYGGVEIADDLRTELERALLFDAACEYHCRAAVQIAEAAEIADAIADGDLDADGEPVAYEKSYWVGHL